MSAVAPSLGDDQPVVGEPASHPHQGVVVGEHPENQAPVVGEPAFSNGPQDQRPILPSTADITSANGVQSPQHPPLHEDTPVPGSHVTATPSASTVGENPNAQQVTTAASNPGSRDGVTHDGETPITENSMASSDVETAHTPVASASVEEAQGADLTEDTVITHIDDEPHLPRSEVPTENPFGALEEGEDSEESKVDSAASHVSVAPVEESPNEQQAPVTTAASNSGIREGVINEREIPISENPTVSSDVEAADTLNPTDAAANVEEVQGGDLTKDAEVTHIEDDPYIPRAEIPTENPFSALEHRESSEESKTDTSMTQEEISSKGLADKHQQVLPHSTVEEKQSTEHSIPSHTEADNGPVEGSQAMIEDNDSDVRNARVDQNDSRVDRAISTGTVQENKVEIIDANDRSVDIPSQTEVTNKEVQHGLREVAPEPKDSSVKSSPPKSVDDLALTPDSNNVKESAAEAHLMDSSAISPGTRGIAVEECSNQKPANVDNPHHLDKDGDRACEKEQDLQSDNSVDASIVSEKSNFGGIKFPLILTGLAIAVVGVAVAAFRRSR